MKTKPNEPKIYSKRSMVQNELHANFDAKLNKEYKIRMSEKEKNDKIESYRSRNSF